MNIYKLANVEQYISAVNADVHFLANQNKIFNTSGKVSVSFQIEIEARSWGIKGIYVYPTGVAQISGIVESREGDRNLPEEDKTIAVDLTKIKSDYQRRGNGVVTLGDMTVYIDDNYQVDYGRSSIEILV